MVVIMVLERLLEIIMLDCKNLNDKIKVNFIFSQQLKAFLPSFTYILPLLLVTKEIRISSIMLLNFHFAQTHTLQQNFYHPSFISMNKFSSTIQVSFFTMSRPQHFKRPTGKETMKKDNLRFIFSVTSIDIISKQET